MLEQARGPNAAARTYLGSYAWEITQLGSIHSGKYLWEVASWEVALWLTLIFIFLKYKTSCKQIVQQLLEIINSLIFDQSKVSRVLLSIEDITLLMEFL